jgi:hypothetical protein
VLLGNSSNDKSRKIAVLHYRSAVAQTSSRSYVKDRIASFHG